MTGRPMFQGLTPQAKRPSWRILLVIIVIGIVVSMMMGCASPIQKMALAPLPAGDYTVAKFTTDSAGGKLEVIKKSPTAAAADLRSEGIKATGNISVVGSPNGGMGYGGGWNTVPGMVCVPPSASLRTPGYCYK